VAVKFEALDQNYFRNRAAFAERYSDADFWFIADNWPLFAGDVNITRFLAIYEIIKKICHLPGHFCELGCWNGTNLLFIAKVLKILAPRDLTRVYGFDSFEGLTRFDEAKDSGAVAREYKGNVQLLEDAIRLHELESIELIRGNIEETVPAFLHQQKDVRFSFIYVDVDLYGPTKVALDTLYPKLLDGGILALDEYNTEHWPGETTGVHEVLGDDVHLIKVPHTRQPTAYLVKGMTRRETDGS
jgi:Macrocin-O-methyltransferase (TylF)